MSQAVGVYVCQQDEQHTKTSIRFDSVRNTGWENGLLPVVACVQMFSNKFQTFLNAGSLIFYPVYVKNINFSEQMRRFEIHSGSIVVAFVAVPFYSSSAQREIVKPLLRRMQRTALQQSLHACIETSPAHLLECAY